MTGSRNRSNSSKRSIRSRILSGNLPDSLQIIKKMMPSIPGISA